MVSDTVNVLLTSFKGLNLPPTLSIPLSADLPISSFANILADRLPSSIDRVVITTNSNRRVDPASDSPLSSLLSSNNGNILPLRLSAVVCGGKGGFGSQLRAAGGRMSSRKNKKNQQDINASNRNLDGRRLRTITEAKNLAEYLAVKPDMDKKERDERRRRWEAVVEAAEKKEDEVKKGKGKARLDGEWVEAKEDAEGKTRDAVLMAMKAGLIGKENERAASESSGNAEGEEEDESEEAEASGSSSNEETKAASTGPTKVFYGWDEDEDMSDDEEQPEVGDDTAPQEPTYDGKGKAPAT